MSFTSFEDNKLALQVLDGQSAELLFVYADLDTNELAFRGSAGRCRITKVPELFKLDLVNFHNLWDYLFFLTPDGHWRLDWPVGPSLFQTLFSELHYFGPLEETAPSSRSEIRMRFGVNELALREDSRKEEKIFFERLESFKRECAASEDLATYLKDFAREVGLQFFRTVKAQVDELKDSFLKQG